MRWPDIFFKAKTPDPGGKPPTASFSGAFSGSPGPGPTPVNAPPLSEAAVKRLSARLAFKINPPGASSASPDKNVVRDMAEADTLRSLSRSHAVRLVRRPLSDGPLPPSIQPLPTNAGAVPLAGPEVSAKLASIQPDPAKPANANPPETSRIDSPPAASATEKETSPPPSPELPAWEGPAAQAPADAPSAIPPAPTPAQDAPTATITDPTPPAAPALVFRRRTKMADVARIILPPPRREEAHLNALSAGREPGPASSPAIALKLQFVPASLPKTKPSGTVFPAAFPVALPSDRFTSEKSDSPAPAAPVPAPEKPAGRDESAPPDPAPHSSVLADTLSSQPAIKAPSHPTAPAPESGKMPAPVVNPYGAPYQTSAPESAASQASSEAPPAPAPQPPVPAPDTREKREFLLSNGERILGHILSETPEAIYINHDTLGVLTIPRAQIAQRPIEIILINGDRIVGDVVAETSDALFVRHASLGILTVPHTQRSTRVVEAILKDGDRILGEVLGETESFTVIRSATLGTVAVPHNRVAMLNRKIEQIQVKALPPATAALENKPGS